MLLFPTRGIIFLRKADSDAKEMIGMVSKILKSATFQDLCTILYGLPLTLTSESEDHISTCLWSSPMGSHQLQGFGIKGSITGKHADLVITDDICNIQDRISRAERNHTRMIYQELQNIKNRDGRIINLGTPWHKDDVFALMPNIHRYDCYMTSLISYEKLEELRKSMTPTLFAANYELKHIATSETIFKTSPRFFSDPIFLQDGISHVDAAYGGADTTCFTCGCWHDDTLYMYGRLWHSHVEDKLDVIISEADKYQCFPIYCESNGDKGFLRKRFLEKDAYAKNYFESENKITKIGSYLRKYWDQILWYEGTDPEYLDQIIDYTEQAEHDDAPDSAACVCRILDRHC